MPLLALVCMGWLLETRGGMGVLFSGVGIEEVGVVLGWRWWLWALRSYLMGWGKELKN